VVNKRASLSQGGLKPEAQAHVESRSGGMEMRKVRVFLPGALMLLVLLCGAAVFAANLSWDFENYSLGPLSGQDGWTSLMGTETVTNDPSLVLSGNQSVQLLGNGEREGRAEHSLAGQAFTDNTTTFTGLFRVDEISSKYALVELNDTVGLEYEWVYGGPEGFLLYANQTLMNLGTCRFGIVYRMTISFDFPNHQRRVQIESVTDTQDSFDSGFVPIDGWGSGSASINRNTAAGAIWLRGDGGIWDDVAFHTPPVGAIKGHVSLADYEGAADLAPVNIDVINGGATIRTLKNALDANGDYDIEALDPGPYDLAFSACKWLKTVIAGVVVTSDNTTIQDALLMNGDLNGDSSIGLLDLGILKKGWGQHS
jgi:hypothetical protein